VLTSSTSVIHAKEIKLPADVELYHVNPEDTVVSISSAVEIGELVQVDLSSIEVEKKGKKEVEADASGTDAE
jgi:hypothetical protein